MNWNLVWWFAGICATFVALKFVIVFFRSLFSRDMMEEIIDKTGQKINNANKNLTEKIRKKAVERKQKKEEEKEKKKEEWKPTVEPRRLYY